MINKPIEAFPYNCGVVIGEDISIRYEIPNNQTIDGRCVTINDLSDGSVVVEDYKLYDTPTDSVSLNVGDKLSVGKEYIWSSIYWQTPQKNPSIGDRVVYGIENETNNIRLKPSGGLPNTITPEYRVHQTFSGYYPGTNMMSEEKIYNSSIFETCGHEFGDDTSSFCERGTLEDYFGYSGFCLREGDLIEYIKIQGAGNCVLELREGTGEGSLIAATKIIAYDKAVIESLYGWGHYFIIVENSDFLNLAKDRFGTERVFSVISGTQADYFDMRCIPYSFGNLIKIDTYDFDENISGIINHGTYYYYIKDCEKKDYYWEITTSPSIIDGDISVGDSINIWNFGDANFNITPTYYFRTKQKPIISVVCPDIIKITQDAMFLKDVKSSFGLEYTSSLCGLNYFYLYLYVFNSKNNEWELKERSPMLKNQTDTYEFVGFVDGQNYKILALCIDNDGDEWLSNECKFMVYNPALTTTYTISTKFNKINTTIDISFGELLGVYKNFSIDFYRALKTDIGEIATLEYAGGGLCKTGGEYGLNDNPDTTSNGSIISFNTFFDYNIKNDANYDYYARISYTGRNYDLLGTALSGDESNSSGVDFIQIVSDIHTDFEGDSIIGLTKGNNSNLIISNCFKLFYKTDNISPELTNNISREYIGSFNKYPKELKGQQNYVSEQCSGLLGSEKNGIYEEPKGIQDAWIEFINDDTIKFYRGVNGRTMIVSIESSRIKPSYYPQVGIVNEVNFSLKEIDSANKYAVFATENVGG